MSLHAFVVGGGTVSVPDLERHCLDRLPRYMVPMAFTLCLSLPKTSTGKVDRPALQAGVGARVSEAT
jgi:acyl-CoA synthetase (AMP-forming)/AMP-acid ligase II